MPHRPDLDRLWFDPAEMLIGGVWRPASQTLPPYYYRHYETSKVYLGVSSADNHAWFVDAAGAFTDLGLAATWSAKAGCR